MSLPGTFSPGGASAGMAGNHTAPAGEAGPGSTGASAENCLLRPFFCAAIGPSAQPGHLLAI
jgi:hypothetical protein